MRALEYEQLKLKLMQEKSNSRSQNRNNGYNDFASK